MKYQDIIKKMTLEEKASLMSGKDFWQTKNIDSVNVPSIFLSDGPHGIRKQAAAADHLGLNASIPATCFPTAATMANSWDDRLGEEMGAALGEEAVSEKVNMLLGPGTNIKRNPRCGRDFEYFSEDPYLAGKMAAAYIRGIQSNGISACVKHFACNNQEERRMVSNSVVDERALREIYLTAFEIAVKEGKTKSIMSSYNKLNGEYTNENPHLLVDILRKEWGYKGVVVTDWAGENDRVAGLKCGNELEMPGCNCDTDRQIVKAIKEGRLDESVLDENVDRLLTLIFDTEKAFKGEKKEFDVEKHHAMALKCAESSLVLLKNDNGVLPLKGTEKIALIGDFAENPRYQGAGSSVVNPTKLDKTIDVINEYKLNLVGYEKGFDRYGKKKNSLVKSALELASKADVVLYYMGLDEVTEAEGLDREDIKLPANQIALLKELKKTGKKIITVLSCGSCVETGWVEDTDALVHAYLSGQAGAKAILNVITGKVNPSGRLSESYPIRYEDCSSATHFPGHQLTAEYRESIFVGYRYYDTANVKVRFPFGYGLSYTTFEYSDFAMDDKGVSCTVKNTGKVDGYEVVQMYVGAKESKVFRAKKELKGFKKVFVKAGESVKVTIPFDDKTFRFFNVKTNAWEEEPCTYVVMIGASVEDIRLSGELKKQGEPSPIAYDFHRIHSYYIGQVANVGDDEFMSLLGYPIPEAHFAFYKKNRMVIHENCTVADLRYSKRWVGRAFSGGVRFAIAFLKAVGNRTMANTLVMGVLHQPMRGIGKFGGLSTYQVNGMIAMFNGKFFKGLGMIIHNDPELKKQEKDAKSKA